MAIFPQNYTFSVLTLTVTNNLFSWRKFQSKSFTFEVLQELTKEPHLIQFIIFSDIDTFKEWYPPESANTYCLYTSTIFNNGLVSALIFVLSSKTIKNVDRD